ncbi:glycine betaine/L-proline ABC transporter ATP-binding protein [Blautia liquoris]|uniref:Quaternary amine transport ATP-binding protein n=1 Tax=Blautia liquoris TaxID=2779518 RepID=A0A7M2RJV5_9FIRM|nr:glycine betaine/L-proline ABC transporter ATP-binding protein [Blautia liquoris]QOV20585.1 glycine betaine/L-proline ABC transporter ATP-binding protein [Blautia liquoris]
MDKLEVKNVYKIYGSSPKQMIPYLEKGENKKSILKKHKHSVGVNNASFHVGEGEIFVIMGLSGSGKSTLVRCLNRLIEPTSGEIYIDGEDVVHAAPAKLREIRRNKIAMVFQNFALLPHRNVLDNVAFGLEIQNVDVEERRNKAMEMLEVVGLKGYQDSMPKELSGGMQQRVGLARALAINADILLMDEAFSALDPLIRNEMQNELLNIQAKIQKTIVFITHDLDEALKLGDRIAIMKDGDIVQIGTPEDILHHPANDYVKEFTHGVNRSKVVTAESIMRNSESAILEKAGLRTAAKVMNNLGISSIFVTDKKHKLLGIVTIDKVSELMKNKETNLESAIDRDIQTVHLDTLVDDIIPLFFESKYPIGVVDDDGILKGIIFKSTVLAGISGREDD